MSSPEYHQTVKVLLPLDPAQPDSVPRAIAATAAADAIRSPRLVECFIWLITFLIDDGGVAQLHWCFQVTRIVDARR
ncbi:MAG: hypothetical protein EBR52_00295 [Microbacteriaceae bacterium]|nr:hypothetical protein [Microbacteriaceae bacterium]